MGVIEDPSVVPWEYAAPNQTAAQQALLQPCRSAVRRPSDCSASRTRGHACEQGSDQAAHGPRGRGVKPRPCAADHERDEWTGENGLTEPFSV